MKKYFLTILIALIMGGLMAKFMFEQYNSDANLRTVFNAGTRTYLLQYGVYSTKESMTESMQKFENYIYSIENDNYHAFITITQNRENVEKLKGFWGSKDYDIVVKEININDNSFNSMIEQYDNLLMSTDDERIIATIIYQVLSKYEELIEN